MLNELDPTNAQSVTSSLVQLGMRATQHDELRKMLKETKAYNWRSCTEKMNIFNDKDFDSTVEGWYWKSKAMGKDMFYKDILNQFMI